MSDDSNILLNVCDVVPIPGAETAFVVCMECNGFSVFLARRTAGGGWAQVAADAVALLGLRAAAVERAHERAQWEVG
jgi:hypothetical protein